MLRSPHRIWWRRILCWYAPLSLSSMAGMSLGGSLFLAASFWSVGRSWKGGGGQQVKEAFRHPILLASLAIFLVSAMSLAWAWISPPLGEPFSGFKELKKFHYFLYPPFIALAFLYTADEIEKHPFWKYWGGMGIFCGILACLQFFGGDLFPEAWRANSFFRAAGESGRYRGQGLMSSHLSFAACMSFVAATGLARLLWPFRWDGKKERIFWAIVALAGLLAVFFSSSGLSVAGIFVMAAFLFFLKRPFWGSVALATLIVSSVLIWWQVPSARERIHQSSSAVTERMPAWNPAWEILQDRPVLGVGIGRSGHYAPEYARRLHSADQVFAGHTLNNAFDALASTGVLGLLAFLGWWAVLFVSAWRSFRAASEKWLPAAALAAFIAFQIIGLAHGNFWDGKSQHTLMIWAGVVLALSLRRRRQEERAFWR